MIMKTLDKIKFAKGMITGSCRTQLHQEWIYGAAAGIGLSQGLKYNGSIKRGLSGAAATIIVICAANVVYNTVSEWDKIKKVMKEE